jgi:hypothetical protein
MQSADCRLQISTINICRIGQHECFLKNPLISKSVQRAKMKKDIQRMSFLLRGLNSYRVAAGG